MQLQGSSTLSLTAFTLYPITLGPIKTCYQSQNYKILCSISGPYYQRSSSIQPTLNIKVNSCNKNCTQIIQKLRQTLNNSIVKEKYQRMKFDINFDVLEGGKDDQLGLYAPLVNLLCYTAVLNGMEIKALFTCCGLRLLDEKKVDLIDNQITQEQLIKSKSMILGVEHLNKQSFLTIWQGEFVFLHYQRLANILLTCNDQIQQFIKGKILQAYDQFN